MILPERKPSQPPIWGLTGGIAAGKSRAAQEFTKLGAEVIDADQIARTLSLPGGRAADAIQKEFGTLDRAAIRDQIFSDTGARKKLEAILHPLIQEESRRRIISILARPNPPRVVIYEAALLVEAGEAGRRMDDFDALVVVTAPEDVRIQRLMARGDLSRPQALQMIRAQISDTERLAKATHVIENNGSVEELQKKIAEIMEKFAPATG